MVKNSPVSEPEEEFTQVCTAPKCPGDETIPRPSEGVPELVIFGPCM